MNLCIQREIFTTFNPIIGTILARGIDNCGNPAEIADLLRHVEEDTRQQFAQFESYGRHPHIAAWRAAYKRFGADPHQYRCSVESLVRRVLKGDQVSHINKLVDLYNYISLKFMIPVGGEDMNAIKGDLWLAFADGTENFVRLNGSENEPPERGEVVYKDAEGVICRRWNWREADRTKLIEDTTDAIIVFDATAPIDRGVVGQAMGEMAELVRRFCGGRTESFVFDAL